MKHSLTALLVFLLLVAGGTRAYAPILRADPTVAELEKLAGTWDRILFVQDGDKNDSFTGNVSIAGSEWVFNEFGRASKPWRVKLNVKTKPKQIDLIKSGDSGVILRGVYSLDGDTFSICYRHSERINSKRPASADGRDSGDSWHQVFKKRPAKRSGE